MTRRLANAAERGFALTTSLIIVAIVGALIAGTVFTTQFETNVALNDAAAAQAQYVAQAGLQKYKAVLFQAFRYNESFGSGGALKCENSLSVGIDIFRDGAIYYWNNDRIALDPEPVLDVAGNVIGTYTVTLMRDPNNHSRITVVSQGANTAVQGWRQATARATSTFVIRNSAGIEQAIFAGSGHGMKFFNGNTEVYGGVHIVGDKDHANDPVIDTKGNSRILNNYTKSDTSGSNDFLVSAVQEAENLCASVRVQYGRVLVNGNANFGSASHPLLTVAVGDEPEDLQGVNTDCSKNKGNVCADNVGIFDLWESAPVFPLLDEEPGTEHCPTGTWRQCIRQEAEQDGMTLALTAEGASTVQLIGSLAAKGAVLPSACQSALNAAAAKSDNALVFSNSTNKKLDCTVEVDGRKYGFTYDNGKFETFGNLNFRGLSLVFEQDVTYTATSRSSTGALQKFSAITLESVGADGGTFMASSSFVANSGDKFPNNVITMVAEQDVILNGKNKDSYTLPAYAGRDFMSASGTRVFGQAIADRFCTVPSGKTSCTDKGGSPAQIFFVPTGHNRPNSFNAISPMGGLPTFRVEAYELR